MWIKPINRIITTSQVYEPGSVEILTDYEPPEDDFPFDIEFNLIEKDNQWTLDDTNFDKTTKTDYYRANQAIESALKNLNTWRGETQHLNYGLCPIGGEYILVGKPTKQAKQMLVQASQNIWEYRRPTYRILRQANLIDKIWWTIDSEDFSSVEDYYDAQNAVMETLKSLRLHVTLTGDWKNITEPRGEYQLVHTESTGYFLVGEPTAYETLKYLLFCVVNHLWHDGRLPPYQEVA